jgi:hypothetical protein
MAKDRDLENPEYVKPTPPAGFDGPEWVPVLIQEQILLFSYDDYRRRPSALRLAQNLASDPRMKIVWAEFEKRVRARPEEYLNPYAHLEIHPRYNPEDFRKLRAFMRWRGIPHRQLPKLNPSDSESLQNWATWRFFREAFHLAYDRKPAKRVYSELNRDRKAYRRLAPHLRQAALLLGKYKHSDAETVGRLADGFEAATPIWHPGMLTNDKGDWKARSYVGSLAHEVHYLFGKVLPRTIATTASIALGHNLTGHQVKSMIASSRNTRTDFPPL